MEPKWTPESIQKACVLLIDCSITLFIFVSKFMFDLWCMFDSFCDHFCEHAIFLIFEGTHKRNAWFAGVQGLENPSDIDEKTRVNTKHVFL